MEFSQRFLEFLADYAAKVGKDSARIVEESTAQAILRHSAPDEPKPVDAAILMPDARLRQLLSLLPDIDPASVTHSPFGTMMERLPDLNWVYQLARLDDWWLLVLATAPQPLPEPLELRAQEENQAYAWVFGYDKAVRVYSSNTRILVVF